MVKNLLLSIQQFLYYVWLHGHLGLSHINSLLKSTFLNYLHYVVNCTFILKIQLEYVYGKI